MCIKNSWNHVLNTILTKNMIIMFSTKFVSYCLYMYDVFILIEYQRKFFFMLKHTYNLDIDFVSYKMKWNYINENDAYIFLNFTQSLNKNMILNMKLKNKSHLNTHLIFDNKIFIWLTFCWLAEGWFLSTKK